MKKNFSLGIATILFAIISFTISSCSTDKCKGVTCQNGGTCVNGNCNCASGYEGTSCQTKANAKFVGTYNGNLTCDGASPSADAYSVIAGTSPLAIIINQNGTATLLAASVSNMNISIPSQDISGATFSGSGTLNGNNITLNITFDDNAGNISHCTFTGTK